MTSPLFRQEVLGAQRAQYLGSICIGRNPRHATVAASLSAECRGIEGEFGRVGQVLFVFGADSLGAKARSPGLTVNRAPFSTAQVEKQVET